MRFLVDQQLPPALARFLAARGHLTEHVSDIGLGAATDTEVWGYALAHGAALITKDEDFSRRHASLDPAPVIVWIRLGNASRSRLLAWLEPLLPSVISGIEAGERLIELR